MLSLYPVLSETVRVCATVCLYLQTTADGVAGTAKQEKKVLIRLIIQHTSLLNKFFVFWNMKRV